jgi:hypothetical protein
MNQENYGIKHLITCRCILPQFKLRTDPPVHQFVVFSSVENDAVQTKYAQCNNCGIIHKVIDLCKSEILKNKEELKSIITIQDIEQTLPHNLVNLLNSNKCDLPTWEFVSYIFLNKLWGNFVIMTSDFDYDENIRTGKYVQILSESLFKVDSFSREEILRQ